MSSHNTGSSSLRPAWYKGAGGGGGRGFQPPPTVTSDRGDKARSSSWGSQERRDANKFSALQDEDDGNGKAEEKPSGNSRSEAFRTSFGRSSSGPKPPGRSLADLAARVPDSASTGRRHPSSYESRGSAGSGRFSSLRTGEQGGTGGSGSVDTYKPDPKVIRYTREKLLSMRPPSNSGDQTLPVNLVHLDGSSILSKAPQDPVCWDTLDAEEIWEPVRERRLSAGLKAGGGSSRAVTEAVDDPRRRNAPSSGRWQRGVALPPADESGRRKERDAENPNELWDDPVGGATGAASDFSAFGAMPDDPTEDTFDFDKMAEASKKLEEELHGPRDSDGDDSDENHHSIKVDPSRPLASAGMTLTSGSGDDVNVFEDFDAPNESPNESEPASAAIRGGDEDPSASSRLMKMIGVTKDSSESENLAKQPTSNPWGTPGEEASNPAEQPPLGLDQLMALGGGSSSIPLNPWGNPAPVQQSAESGSGMDLASRLEVFAAEQKAREDHAAVEMEKRAQEAEMLRRRQEEEVQRRAMAQRQAEEQARQQHAQVAAMQQQAAPQQSQVELVLMERICAILENSWGRSDLVSILTTLHSEVSRVIPLLSNVDALRALIARSPQRVALRRDPNFAGDMAVLSMTNNQWQQQQQQVQARLQQEELQRRRMEEEAAARAQSQNAVAAPINPDAPWFYSDPQNNIQGPFRGEEMRQWLEAGYFKGDLPISQQSTGPFVPLSALFPDLSVAFKGVIANAVQEEAESRAAARAAAEEEEKRRQEAAATAAEEEERRAAEAAAAKAEQEARKAAEREMAEKERLAAEAERAAAEAAKAAEAASNGGNESSAQLKMMLGLSAESESVGVEKDAEDTVENSAPVAHTKRQSPEKRSAKSTKKSQPKPAEDALEPVLLEKTAKPSTAWGGAANAKPKKSMSEIQQEEARAAAIMAMQRDNMPRQSSSGWANVAASGKSGWSSGTLKQTAVVANSNVAQNARQPQLRTKAQHPAQGNTASKATPITQQQRSNSTASSSTPAEEFGTTMSPILEKWCKEQMQKINGSDDLTLVAFCMTLEDANEIRQYLTTYLGSTSQVNNFATEFINMRGLGNRQEEWETPGSAKKGRKKKAGGR